MHLVTHLLNAPDGVNLLSNASLILLGILLAPVTLAFGAPVSFAILVAGNLGGTAVAWYLLMVRTLGLRRFAAGVGAACAGFAPGMMSQSNAHVHITAQWLVPAMVWCVIRLARTDDEVIEGLDRVRRVLGTGALLGGLITVQLFIGEEVLFLTAATLAVFCVAYALLAPRAAARTLWPLTAGLAVAAAGGDRLCHHGGRHVRAVPGAAPDHRRCPYRHPWAVLAAGGAAGARQRAAQPVRADRDPAHRRTAGDGAGRGAGPGSGGRPGHQHGMAPPAGAGGRDRRASADRAHPVAHRGAPAGPEVLHRGVLANLRRAGRDPRAGAAARAGRPELDAVGGRGECRVWTSRGVVHRAVRRWRARLDRHLPTADLGADAPGGQDRRGAAADRQRAGHGQPGPAVLGSQLRGPRGPAARARAAVHDGLPARPG